MDRGSEKKKKKTQGYESSRACFSWAPVMETLAMETLVALPRENSVPLSNVGRDGAGVRETGAPAVPRAWRA